MSHVTWEADLLWLTQLSQALEASLSTTSIRIPTTMRSKLRSFKSIKQTCTLAISRIRTPTYNSQLLK